MCVRRLVRQQEKLTNLWLKNWHRNIIIQVKCDRKNVDLDEIDPSFRQACHE